MTLILAVGSILKCIMTLNLCLIPLKKILEIRYTYDSLTQTTKKKDLVEGNNIFYFSDNGWEGVYSEQNKDDQKEKYFAKEMRAYILVSRVRTGVCTRGHQLWYCPGSRSCPCPHSCPPLLCRGSPPHTPDCSYSASMGSVWFDVTLKVVVNPLSQSSCISPTLFPFKPVILTSAFWRSLRRLAFVFAKSVGSFNWLCLLDSLYSVFIQKEPLLSSWNTRFFSCPGLTIRGAYTKVYRFLFYLCQIHFQVRQSNVYATHLVNV